MARFGIRRAIFVSDLIDLIKTTRGGVRVFCDDGFGVVRSVARDVFDRLLDAGDDADRKHRREIFTAPIFFSSDGHVRDGARGFIAA